MRISLILVVASIFCALICYGAPETNIVPLREGTVLIYQHHLESQYLPGEESYDEYVEVYDKDINDKIKVGRKIWEHTEKVSAIDNGLKYGFPLKVGMKWDNEYEDGFKRYDHGYCKYVEKIADVTVPAGTFKNCFVIVHRTCPDIEIWWYCPGVGIVKYKYHHNGTITNDAYELKKIITGE